MSPERILLVVVLSALCWGSALSQALLPANAPLHSLLQAAERVNTRSSALSHAQTLKEVSPRCRVSSISIRTHVLCVSHRVTWNEQPVSEDLVALEKAEEQLAKLIYSQREHARKVLYSTHKHSLFKREEEVIQLDEAKLQQNHLELVDLRANDTETINKVRTLNLACLRFCI